VKERIDMNETTDVICFKERKLKTEHPIGILIQDKRTAKGKNLDTTFEWLEKRNCNPIVTSETPVEYAKLPREKQTEIKDVGGIACGKFRNAQRKSRNAIELSIGGIDADHIPSGVDFPVRVKEILPSTRWFIYSTHRHTPDNPRCRLMILFNRKVKPDEYPALLRMLAKKIGIDWIDEGSYETNRLFFFASHPTNGDFVFESNDGEPLDVDAILSEYSDWRDCSLWPTSSRHSEVILRSAKQQADPLGKSGVIGAFCRAYSIQDVIERFLTDIYEPSSMDGRYDYIPADSTAGVVIYDDKFAYSHHATDPAYGKLLNAFDLVRIHKYGDLDENASFKAMAEFAIQDALVKEQFAEERKFMAKSEFTDADWEKKLDLDKSGKVKNTLKNLMLILENDPVLKGIVFNQLSDGMEIIGEVPWQHPSKFWRDADDAQLISYIDSHYGSFSSRNYDIAVTKVTDDRSYHPIREFIDALPDWDGIPRVNTLLVDYLGSADNAYVRSVTRKTLCAAIARILTPGIKFDSMLVLNGPQGVGKSTLIAKLGGEWFSDSLSLSDTKDKTAAEKLQGYWILEIGELAGLKKAELETLRSFLSRQNDIYRASFGRRATPHLRQCVFFGTTNAEKGYLRDTTGNRRFWPVKTPGNGKWQSWQLTQEEVLQIWAETLTYVKAGEKLYLDAGMEMLAKEEQREAMESDEREGLVREYLDMLLPEEWNTMDLYERRAFINGTEFGESRRIGVIERQYVSNMEIWCECFGKDRANLRRVDGNEISAIMAGISGWSRLVKRERIPLYGQQWLYMKTL
jgi:putative DNA primase/helicase